MHFTKGTKLTPFWSTLHQDSKVNWCLVSMKRDAYIYSSSQVCCLVEEISTPTFICYLPQNLLGIRTFTVLSFRLPVFHREVHPNPTRFTRVTPHTMVLILSNEGTNQVPLVWCCTRLVSVIECAYNHLFGHLRSSGKPYPITWFRVSIRSCLSYGELECMLFVLYVIFT